MTNSVPVRIEVESAAEQQITAEAEVYMAGPESEGLSGGTFTIEQLRGILSGADRLARSAHTEVPA